MTRPDSHVGPARDALDKVIRGLTLADGMKLIRRLKQAQARPARARRTKTIISVEHGSAQITEEMDLSIRKYTGAI